MKSFDEYQPAALRTAKRMNEDCDLMHAALGLAGEAGEFADAIKKYLVYAKPLDRANAIEEIGDILWYCALACETLGVNMSEVAEQNISKLMLRYPEKYTDVLAAKRLDKEPPIKIRNVEPGQGSYEIKIGNHAGPGSGGNVGTLKSSVTRYKWAYLNNGVWYESSSFMTIEKARYFYMGIAHVMLDYTRMEFTE